MNSIHFDEVLLQSPVGMAVMDFNGFFEAANPSYCAIYGYSEEELLGKNVTLVFPPDQRQRVIDLHQKFLTDGGSLGGEWEVVHRDGTLRHVITNSARIIGTDGEKRRLVYVIDITTRQRMERELEDSLNFSQAVLDGISAQVCVLDETGVIITTNQSWRDFYLLNGGTPGMKFEGVSYLNVCDCAAQSASPERHDAIKFFDLLKEVLAGQRDSFQVPNTCHSPSEKRWFLVRVTRIKGSAPMRLVVSHDEVTKLAEAQELLRISEARWKFAIEQVGDGLWDWNIRTGKAFYSPRYKAMLGYAEEEIGASAEEWRKRIHPDDAPGVYAALQPYLDGKQGAVSVEMRMLCKDGSWMSVVGRVMVVERDASGKALRMIGINSDITERKAQDAKRQLAASVFGHAREGIIISNQEGTIVDVNDSFTRITGYSRAEVIGQNPSILNSGHQDKAFYQAMWDALTTQGHWSGEIWNRRKNGEVYAELLTISALRDGTGNTHHYVALFSDITAIKKHQSELEHIAHFDALTNLPNRLLLADRLQQAMVQALRRGQQLAVAYLDLDGFKLVNDRHGHDVGDQLLVTLATAMKDTLREGDTLARLGGDEFVAVLIDLDGIESCGPMVTRLLEAAAAPVQLGDVVLQGSASLGVTFYPQANDMEADQLLRQADQAMYQAKLAGKNRYHVFDAAQDSSMRLHHESLERIHHALQHHEFVLHYQPKVNLHSGQVIGAEALIRWQHPERGLLAPAAFLPEIEDHPLAVDVGEWVMDTALTQMQVWRTAGLELPVSVNVGARQLQQTDFMGRLQAILARHPHVNPASLQLEVLETSALADIVQVAQVIEDCARIGVTFALDDFGTGYSSLTYLKRLRVAQLKIDQSFVHDMLEDRNDLAILEGVIGLAAAFKREVIAEGVETAAHGTALLNLGCELAQGYGISRPMPPEQIPAWVATWKPDAAWSAVPISGEMSRSKKEISFP